MLPRKESNKIWELALIWALFGKRPIMASEVMDLPDPDSPTTPKIFPFPTENETFFRISFSPNFKERFFISMLFELKDELYLRIFLQIKEK